MSTAFVPSADLAAAARNHRATPSRFTWGWDFLSRILPAPVEGSLTVVGADTGTGKTFFTLGLLRAIAEHGPTLFISLEDPAPEVGRRLGFGLAHPNLYVAFPERNHLSDLLALVDDFAARRPLMVAIDYIQLIAYDGDVQTWSKADSVSKATAACKAAGKRAGVPVLLTSQLRRPTLDEAGTVIPGIHALKESGDIEAMAEYIFMLGGRRTAEYVTAEVSKAKSAPVGARFRFRRGAGGVLVPVNEAAASEGDGWE